MSKNFPGKRLAPPPTVKSDKFRPDANERRFVHTFFEVRHSAVAICCGPWTPLDVSDLKLRS